MSHLEEAPAVSAAGPPRHDWGVPMRASDADRNRAVQVLQRATADGYMSLEEFEAALGRAFEARYLTDLDTVLAEIPGAPRPSIEWTPRPAPPPRPPTVTAPAWSSPVPFGVVLRIAVGVILALFVLSALAHAWFPPFPLFVFGFLWWRRSHHHRGGRPYVNAA
jgi:hypothetical protein